MSAISTRMPAVTVEYDARGKRTSKRFEDANQAKQFYGAKMKAGKQPSVKGDARLAKEVTATNGAAKSKPAASKANGTAAAKPKPAVKRDRFGNRIGTQAAKINAVITAKPQPTAAIAEAVKLNSGRVRAHLKYLLERKHVAETAAGFKVK